MPFSHLHRMAKANCMDDLSLAGRHDNDFSELVWENGQILVQGQSNRNRKSSNNGGTGNNNNGKEEVKKAPCLNDISTTSVPLSRPMSSGQDDELLHWLNYPLDDYSSEFFSEFHQQALSQQNSAVPIMKNISYGGGKLEQGNASRVVRGSHRSRVEESEQPTQPSPNTGLMNFSRFLRPPPLAKPDLEEIVDRGSDRVGIKDDRSGVSCSNHVKSTVIDSTNGSRSLPGYQSKPYGLAPKLDVKVAPSTAGVIPEKEAVPDADCPENVGPTSSFAASTGIEPVVASSSLCSGNIIRGASSDQKNKFKRKYRDSEESDYPSEDAEEESVVVRKPVTARGGMSTKRTRAAEVHNLSERKRRDRINEKMRALQELIPNCNKVDKASMLDEAIEYLKTLQLQLQIMSMGSGMFMPPMMPMQHLNAPHLQPFSQMNAGMGMGMGFGMGMMDMLPVPPLHGGQFPFSPIAGHSSVPMMGGISRQMFGHPGQGMHMSMPCAPFIPHSAGPSMHPTSLPVVSGVATCTEIPDLAMPFSLNRPIENINSALPNRNAECPQNQTSIQETKESFKQSDLEKIHEQPEESN